MFKSLLNRLINNYFFRRYPTFKQFVKFSIVGVSNTLLDFGLYLLLTRIFSINYLIANIFAYSLGVTNSFIFNKIWTFRDKEKKFHFQYLKFWAVSLVGLSSNELILYLLVKEAHFQDVLAKIIATFIVLFWNFTANKFWTFRQRKKI